MKTYLKQALVAIVAVIAFNALCFSILPLKNLVNQIPGSGSVGN